MIVRACAALLLGLVLVSAGTAAQGSAASVALPTNIAGTKQVTDSSQIGANKFKPAQCASLTLTALVVATGSSATSPNAASLIIGNGSQGQTLTGGNGADCIVAGGSNTGIANSLNGGGGNDVLVGGKNAFNSYNGGSGTDTCYYRSHDTVPSAGNCNTRILLP